MIIDINLFYIIKLLYMHINKTITFVVYAPLLSAQFKPSFVKVPKE